MATSGGRTGSHPVHRLEVYAPLREPRTPNSELEAHRNREWVATSEEFTERTFADCVSLLG